MVDSPTNSGLVRLLEVYGNPSHTCSSLIQALA